MSKLKVAHEPIQNIKPFPGNERIHPAPQIDRLAETIEKLGFDVPIVVDEKKVVLKGHGRLEALKKLGRKTAPIIVREGLSKDQKAALRISDNRFSDFGLWDEAKLVAQWNSMDEEFQNLTGWSDVQIGQIDKALTHADGLPKETEDPAAWSGEAGRNPNLHSIEIAFSTKEALDGFRKFINEACKRYKTSFQGDALAKAVLDED